MDLWNFALNQLPEEDIWRLETALDKDLIRLLPKKAIWCLEFMMDEDQASVNQFNQHLLDIFKKLMGSAAVTAANSIVKENCRTSKPSSSSVDN